VLAGAGVGGGQLHVVGVTRSSPAPSCPQCRPGPLSLHTQACISLMQSERSSFLQRLEGGYMPAGAATLEDVRRAPALVPFLPPHSRLFLPRAAQPSPQRACCLRAGWGLKDGDVGGVALVRLLRVHQAACSRSSRPAIARTSSSGVWFFRIRF
jgi:hypothetical protein